MFWYQQHLEYLPDVVKLPKADINRIGSVASGVLMVAAVVGNFLAAAMARLMGYRRAIAVLCLAYFVAMTGTYSAPRSYTVLMVLLPIMGACGGVFALFTMYLPPLFPTLLRTTERASATTSAGSPRRPEP